MSANGGKVMTNGRDRGARRTALTGGDNCGRQQSRPGEEKSARGEGHQGGLNGSQGEERGQIEGWDGMLSQSFGG